MGAGTGPRKALSLTPDDVRQFAADGFVRGPQLLSGAALGAARAALDRVVNRTSPGMADLFAYRSDGEGQTLRVLVVGTWRAEPAIRDLAFDPRVYGAAAALMGIDRVRLFRDQLFFKPALSSGAIPWHQDYSDWVHTTPPSHITCWIALDDATLESGCLHYAPGRPGSIVLPRIHRADTMEAAFERLPREMRESFQPLALPVPAGGCVFHHCLTVHASYGNRTPRPRRAIAITYMHPETRSRGAHPSVPAGPIFAEGERLEGALFPLLGPKA
jgi:ectoine hydroxylase-related dioxygenase (phytanoyl-CoA dioxygenase family)